MRPCRRCRCSGRACEYRLAVHLVYEHSGRRGDGCVDGRCKLEPSDGLYAPAVAEPGGWSGRRGRGAASAVLDLAHRGSLSGGGATSTSTGEASSSVSRMAVPRSTWLLVRCVGDVRDMRGDVLCQSIRSCPSAVAGRTVPPRRGRAIDTHRGDAGPTGIVFQPARSALVTLSGATAASAAVPGKGVAIVEAERSMGRRDEGASTGCSPGRTRRPPAWLLERPPLDRADTHRSVRHKRLSSLGPRTHGGHHRPDGG